MGWQGLRIFLALTVLLDLKPLQIDVDLAYLYANLEEPVYMRPPKGCKVEGTEGDETDPKLVERMIMSREAGSLMICERMDPKKDCHGSNLVSESKVPP